MTEVVSVRFRSGTKNYYFDPRGLQIEPDQYVIVETAQGVEYARCAEGNHAVSDESVVQPLRPVLRVATENDHKTAAYNRKREQEAFSICEKKIAAHKLEMKLVSVECNFEGNKIIFFFTAEGRVDFRELVKDLASVFKMRIELRQIGVRDEAKMLGGLGSCGRPICCGAFLGDFQPVSIKMAKTQNLSLNPTKISGTCGRLMCCLKYEQNAYEDAAKRMPKSDSFVDTPDGIGNVSGVDMLRETVQVRLDGSTEPPKRYKVSEIRVLRNGKGSREGIEIPKERPARYVPPETEEERDERVSRRLVAGKTVIAVPSVLAEEPEEEKGSRSRRRRSGRGKPRAAGEAQAPARAEKKPEEKAARPAKRSLRNRAGEKSPQGEMPEKLPVLHSGDTTAEKKAAADRSARLQGDEAPKGGEGGKPRRSRPRRRPRSKGSGGGTPPAEA